MEEETQEEYLARAKREWEDIQRRKKRVEELERLRQIKPKLSIPQPEKTGLMTLQELFETLKGGEESVCWAKCENCEYRGYKISLFWATKSKILAVFRDFIVSTSEKLGWKPLDEAIVKEIREACWKRRKDQEEREFVEKYGDPDFFGGRPTQAFMIKEKFGQKVVLVTKPPNYGLEEYFLIPLDKLLNLAGEADKRFSYELLGSEACRPAYAILTPITRFAFPVPDHTRGRDGSTIIKDNYEYIICLNKTLSIGKLNSDYSEIERNLDLALELDLHLQENLALTELFNYWDILSKELDKLHTEFTAKPRDRLLF